MAKYTITLEEALALMTEDQRDIYDELLASVVPTEYAEDFAAAFDARYRLREISNGTPAGFLEDLTDAVYSNKLELTALWEEYDINGMFGDHSSETETETPNLTKTRTPNLTKTRTPNLTDTRTPNTVSTDHTVNDDTPNTSGVISGGYAANVIDGRQTLTGTDTVARTGTETNVETGTDTQTETGTKTRTRIVLNDEGVNDHLERGVYNLMIYTLRKFASCFILLY